MKENFKEEFMLFLTLCSERDRQYIEPAYERTAEDYVRFIVICTVFDFKKVRLSIIGAGEKKIDEIINCLNEVKHDGKKLEHWITDFISTIPIQELREAAEEAWRKERKIFDQEDFSILKLL